MQTVDDVSPVIEVGAEIEVGLSVNSSVKSNEAEKVDRPENPMCKTFYSGALSDISSPSETASDLVFKPVNSTEVSYIKPVEILDGCPFSQFSFDKMVKDLDVHAHEENTNNAKKPESSSCSPCGFVPYPEYLPQSKPPVREPLNGSTQPKSVMAPARTSSVLYISSSMFRHIDTKKLSSKNVVAMKLFYPGANASIMLQKLKKNSMLSLLLFTS
ncbi:hypothetical protein ACHWQZ_G006730 [Mnemiopsis leidyi]